MVSEITLIRHFGVGFAALVEAHSEGLKLLMFGANRPVPDGAEVEYVHMSSGYFDFVGDELIGWLWSQQHDRLFWSERTGWLPDEEAHYRFTGFGPLRRFHVGDAGYRVPRRLLDWINTNCGYGIKEHEFSLPVFLVKHRGVGATRDPLAMEPAEWLETMRAEQRPFLDDIENLNAERFFDTSPAGRAEVRKFLQFDKVMMKRLIQDGAQIIW